jgi:hypothetical protein
MSEENPNASNTPQQEPADANLDKPSASTEEPAKPKPQRSNEFWLALASTAATVVGVAATAAVGIWAAHLAYKSSENQVKAESDRVKTQFSREQRKGAYADFLGAEWDLHGKVDKLDGAILLYVKGKTGVQTVYDQAKDWDKSWEDSGHVLRAAELLASQPVYNAISDWSNYDDRVYDLLGDILREIQNGKVPPPTQVATLEELTESDHEPSAKNFEDLAQADLGISR